MWPHNGPLLPWWLQGQQMTRVPWGWADALVLWIFPERALGRKEVLSLKLKGGREAGLDFVFPGGRGLVLGVTIRIRRPLCEVHQELSVPAFLSLPIPVCVFCWLPVAACTWLGLFVPVSACLCLCQGLPVLGVSSLSHRHCHRFKLLFHRVGRGGLWACSL